MSAINDWDNEYARLARAASQLRTTGLATLPHDVQQLRQGLQRLDRELDRLPLPPTEIQRRRRLIQHLSQQQQPATDSSVGATGGQYEPPSLGGGRQSQLTTVLRQQDDIIDELAVGVGRLKTQTAAIGDEARMHVNLLNDMESNLDAAHAGLEGETRRAMQLREDTSLWRLQLIVAGLFILLILLILMGLSP